MKKEYTIALAGNPNSGKTTIFNRLTGAHQHVGNYPGVTVEVKEGKHQVDGTTLRIVDLPGTYSLTGLSVEELVARDFIVEAKPDVVVDIIDASTLERQLYLAVQLLELGVPLVLAFNMSDVAERAGYRSNIPLLSELLGVPIVSTIGTSGKGLEELIDTVIKVASGELAITHKTLTYGRDLDAEIDNIVIEVERADTNPYPGVPSRWAAIKLLENDAQVVERFSERGSLPGSLSTALTESGRKLERLYADPADMLIAEARYGIISGAATEAVTHTIERRHDFSDRLDTVFINPLLGLPVFLVLMYVVFWVTFALGDPAMGLMETFFEWLGATVSGLWPEGSESPVRSLLVDGIVGGVGGVIVFLPNILLLFLAIAFLEDTGYMARVAFIMDRLMHRIGLHGKSFIPMLIGFGCSVPAIMGTRILESRRDRLVTILVIPLMSCGARFPIYSLIIPAFFPNHLRGPMLWIIYIIGILLAIGLTKLLRVTILKGESTAFVMELPPFRIPTVQALLQHAWERGWMYLQKAGTVILALSIILWWASSYPRVGEFSQDYDTQLASLRETYEAGITSLIVDFEPGEEVGNGFQEFDAWLERDDYRDRVTGNGTTAEFVEMVVAIRDLRDDFHSSLEAQGIEEGTADYIAIENSFEMSLAELGDENPEVFRAAETYLDEVLAPYVEGTEEIGFSIDEEKLKHSAIGWFSGVLEPVFRPMGYDWRLVTATLGALAAKEVFVAQLGIVFSMGEADEESVTLREKLQENYNPLIGFCIMLFSLISAPCVATLAITRAETGSWKWALLQFFGLTALGWILTVMVYQVGSAAGIGV